MPETTGEPTTATPATGQVFDHPPTRDELEAWFRSSDRAAGRAAVERPDVPWKGLAALVGAAGWAWAVAWAVARAPGRARLAWPAPLVLFALVGARPAALLAITLYQRFAPAWLRQSCQLTPSCSRYMALAIERHGLRRGVARGAARLRRCAGQDGVDRP
jgi:putative component of membrane protein insertase Oxa1/YidC/SpoIIIJ protein YidD